MEGQAEVRGRYVVVVSAKVLGGCGVKVVVVMMDGGNGKVCVDATCIFEFWKNGWKEER